MKKSEILYFIYDGQCPLCQMGANFYKIKNHVGTLRTIDARTEKDHPIMKEIYHAQLDLDEGMVIKYKNTLYQGEEALHIMARLGADEGILNRINNRLYQSKTLTKLSYPFMKATRNLALKLKGVSKIQNLKSDHE